jgi:hypothetical protein
MIKKGKLFISDWLKMKPYDAYNSVDLEYLVVANKIHQVLKDFDFLTITLQVDFEELKEIAVFLTSYLEDLVSDTNIWNTFVKIHNDKFHKPVPFYNSEHFEVDEYIVGELNFIDVKFLIWYFLNMQNKERFLSPYDEYLNYLAIEVYEILDEDYEYISANDKLKQHYYLKDNCDYYEYRSVAQRFLFDNYLIGVDAKKELLRQVSAIEFDPTAEVGNYHARLINSITDKITISYRTYLLAFRGNEWMTALVGENHNRYKMIETLSEKLCSYFFYEKTIGNYHVFKHVATDKLFELNAESYNGKLNEKADTIYYIEMVNWNSEWILSGVSMQLPFNADLILDEKNSFEARNAISNLKLHKEENTSILKKQFNYFIKYFGSQIVFLDKENLQNTMDTFYQSYNEQLTAGNLQTIEDVKKRQREKGFSRHGNDISKVQSDESIILFFNPNAGYEIYSYIAETIPDSKNQFFKEEDRDLVKLILFSNEFSTEFSTFFINSYAKKLEFFNEGTGKLYLNDLDFLMRFWKNSKFVSKSTITSV